MNRGNNGARVLAGALQYIDALLSRTEEALGEETRGHAAFRHYVPDIPAASRERLCLGVRALRERLAEEVDRLGIPPDTGAVPTSRAVRANLAAVEITLEELSRRDWGDLGWPPSETEGLLRAVALLREEARALSTSLPRDGDEGDKSGGDKPPPEREEDDGGRYLGRDRARAR
ncbi:MAG: hypothetical protein QFX32_05535 [Methanolinea sp.]|nr:hypothetical protein [Methanolinea sp.]